MRIADKRDIPIRAGLAGKGGRGRATYVRSPGLDLDLVTSLWAHFACGTCEQGKWGFRLWNWPERAHDLDHRGAMLHRRVVQSGALPCCPPAQRMAFAGSPWPEVGSGIWGVRS